MNWRTLTGAAPEVIAHRGASGERPEHTLAAYALALAQGADVIEPDLVPSRDGVLFARHEQSLGRSTDISRRPEFAARRRDDDWYSIDFDAAELDTLRAVQPFPGRSRAHDGRHPLVRFADLLRWASQAAAARGRAVTLYPELKHPAELAAQGHDPVPPFLDAMRVRPPGVALRVQCFDVEALRRVHEATGLPCVLLLEADADWRGAISTHRDWLAGIAPDKRALTDSAGRDSELVATAHAAGLRVDAWTFRDDAVGEGCADIEDELCAAMTRGVDGLFCDFPATALAVRARCAERAGRGA
ncbi:glycerophosphodiester phosphodiesterase family protein [Rehaibacterium terrae]|uniref:glycerophosphodiester phosphodiesterase n=1 Tax=Rehaibacterium terrae TaxID=1341696 RepID=A0A7W7V8I3_9GAMM|nr:glycerophosphoryl diester phosphodiesterase [Rehaibacterium terrae]